MMQNGLIKWTIICFIIYLLIRFGLLIPLLVCIGLYFLIKLGLVWYRIYQEEHDNGKR